MLVSLMDNAYVPSFFWALFKAVRTGLIAMVAFYGVCVLSENADFPRWSDFRQLEQEGRWTEATVTLATPEDHNTCSFTYDVDGERFHGRASCGNLAVGAKMPVVYLPSMPGFSSIQSPRSHWYEPMVFLAGLSVFAGVVFGFLMFFQDWSRRRYAWK